MYVQINSEVIFTKSLTLCHYRVYYYYILVFMISIRKGLETNFFPIETHKCLGKGRKEKNLKCFYLHSQK